MLEIERVNVRGCSKTWSFLCKFFVNALKGPEVFKTHFESIYFLYITDLVYNVRESAANYLSVILIFLLKDSLLKVRRKMGFISTC